MLTTKFPFKFNFSISKELVKSGENSSFSVELVWPFETYKSVGEIDYDPSSEYYILKDDKYIREYVTKEEFDSIKESLYILNDDEDTYWGEKSTTYKSENPDKSCIELKIEINASQFIE